MQVRLAAAVMLFVLAGCADKPAATTAGSTNPALNFQTAEPTDTTGAISGIIIDQEIVPVENATITILDLNQTAQSDAAGGFIFENLEPGLYNLEASAKRFLTAQATADVAAGEVTKVRVVLKKDPRPEPYHETFPLTWHDSAGQPLVDFAWDLFRPEGAPAMCDACEWTLNATHAFDTVIIEAVWQDAMSQPTGEATEFYWTIEPTADSTDYESDYCASPCRAEIGGGRWKNNTEFFLMLSYDEDWVALDQRADVYVTFFYYAPPPTGWSIFNETKPG